MTSARAAAALALSAIAPAACAQDWVIGFPDPDQSVTVTADTVIPGRVVLVNRGTLRVQGGATLACSGIAALDDSRLITSAATIRFPQTFAYQSTILAAGNTSLSLSNTTIDGNNRSYGVAVAGTARVDYDHVTVRGFSTWTLDNTAAVHLQSCTNAGEFLCIGSADLRIAGSDTVLFWTVLPAGAVADIDFPAPGAVASWTLGPGTPGVTGIGYTAQLTNCTNVLWSILPRAGSSITVRDSDLRVAGALMDAGGSATISGIANGMAFQDASFGWAGIALRFVNTTVRTWNYYAYADTQLTLQNCIFGECQTTGTARATIIGSICDGSGGYILAQGQSQIILASSVNYSQTTVGENAILAAINSPLLGPAIDVLGQSVMGLFNSPTIAEPRVHDESVCFDLQLDAVHAQAGDQVPLYGSARLIKGPQCPVQFLGYALDFRPAALPNDWHPIGGLRANQVRRAPLGTWNTTPLDAGDYSLRLTLNHSLGTALTLESPASLLPRPCPADFNADGFLDFFDFTAFTDCFEGVDCPAGKSADFTADGFVDFLDFAAFVDAFEAGC